MSDQETAKRYETIASHFVVCSLAELHGLTQSDTETGLRLFSQDRSDKRIELTKLWAEEHNSQPSTMDDSERHLSATRAAATAAAAARLLLDDGVAEGRHFSSWCSTHLKASQEASVREEQSKGGGVSFFQRCSARLWAISNPALLDSLPEPSPALRAQFFVSSLSEAAAGG